MISPGGPHREVCPLNYIAEIRAFFDWIMFNPIPSDAQALWHALMYLNNKCAVKVGDEWLWRVEFSVSNTTLLSILQFSRTQLDRMRNVLIQSGRIRYKKGKGNQCGTYRMIPFDTHYVTQSVTQPDTQTVTQMWHNPCTLINNNNNSNFNNLFGVDGGYAPAPAQEELSAFLESTNAYFGITEELKGEVAEFTHSLFKRFCSRKPTEQDIVMAFHYIREAKQVDGIWVMRFPDAKKELLEYAFEAAGTAGHLNWNYIAGIYRNFFARGINSREDAEWYDAKRER